ncbi:MAG TPA: ADOP family duplicated permease [Acidobacteriaceae bacterium]|nr:ADOP family duplicated permease [Acidobacteriaceae bacterium]
MANRRGDERLREEMEAHLAMQTEQNLRAGMSPEEARRQARLKFGAVEAVREQLHAEEGLPGMESLLRDVRFGMRQMLRHPGFSLTVIVTLAFSVGANTAIFSIANALLLRSLPYAHPEQLGTIFTRITGGGGASDERHHINGEQWELLRDQVPALLPAISALWPAGVDFQAGSHVEYLHASHISAHYFDVLGIRPILGRNFTEGEDRPHGAKAAILSYALWRTAFAGRGDVVGQTILLKGEPRTVVGILPEDAVTPQGADLYVPLQAGRTGEGSGTNFEDIVRLRDGHTWQEADAEINRVWSSRTTQYERAENPSARVSYHTVALQKGQTATLRPQVLALVLAAGFILLIACANLAGLTLVRVLRRGPEIATRLALGASRWHIERQLWIENLLMAAGGGLAAIAVGFVCLRGLLQLLPEHMLPVSSIPLDGRVMAFAMIMAAGTSVLFGMLPALLTRRFDLRSALGTRAISGGGHVRLRQLLIGGEVALTMVLLAGSGLLIRTLIHLQTLPAGFDPRGVMTAAASLDDVRYHEPAAFLRLLEESVAAMRRIPGVESAAVGLSVPYERTLIMGRISFSDSRLSNQDAKADAVYVTPGYFETLRIPLLSGRAFTAEDGPRSQHVAIVNQTFVRRYFHGVNPIGQVLNKELTVVGVVGDVAMPPGIDAAAPLTSEQTLYVPAAQVPAPQLALIHAWFQPSWIVRTRAPVAGLTGQMQRALADVDPNLPFSGFHSMRDLLNKTLAMQRVQVALLTALAVLALLLSAVGVFALVAHMVAQRTREIGIRLALGSTIREAMIEAGIAGVRASAAGLVLGLVLCAGTLRAMRSVIFGISVYDSRAIAAVVLMLSLVVLIAAMAPTFRIAKIDPATILREE